MSTPSLYLILSVPLSEMPDSGTLQGTWLVILEHYSHAELVWVMCAHLELRDLLVPIVHL